MYVYGSVVQVSPDALSPHISELVAVLLECFRDDSWLVRDGQWIWTIVLGTHIKHLQVQIVLHIHTCTHSHIHTCTHSHTHTCTHSHTHTCTHSHTHMYMYIHVAACLACGNFMSSFPAECRPSLPELLPLFTGSLQDSMPSVRQGAAGSLATLVRVYGETVCVCVCVSVCVCFKCVHVNTCSM